jgi:hypothetical protein
VFTVIGPNAAIVIPSTGVWGLASATAIILILFACRLKQWRAG